MRSSDQSRGLPSYLVASITVLRPQHSCSPLLLHVLQNRPVEIATLLLALLEVLRADVCAEGIEERVVLDVQPLDVTAAPQRLGDLPAYIPIYGDDVLRPGLAEIEGVEFPDPNELPYRVGMVVHPEVHHPVVVPSVSTALPHDEQRRRLLPPRVANRSLPGFKRREQPSGEVSAPLFVGLCHRLDRLPADEDVALGRVVLACLAPSPIEALGACEGSGSPLAVNDTHLPVLAVFVGGDQTLDGLIGGLTRGHEIQPPPSLRIICPGPLCARADTRAGAG